MKVESDRQTRGPSNKELLGRKLKVLTSRHRMITNIDDRSERVRRTRNF